MYENCANAWDKKNQDAKINPPHNTSKFSLHDLSLQKVIWSPLDWSSSVQSRSWKNYLCCQVGEKIWCWTIMVQKWQPLLMWGCWWGIMQGEKTVFLHEQMKHFPKYFKRLAELEAYMSELTVIKKTGTTSYKWEQVTFNFISWFCRN